MKPCARVLTAGLLAAASLLTPFGAARAFQMKAPGGRFDAKVIHDPVDSLDVATTPVGTLPAGDRLRAGWDAFRGAGGSDWAIYLDRRSGAPMLVEGSGVAWSAAAGATSVDSLEASVRAFLAANRTILLADDTELVLDRDASAPLSPETWRVVFRRVVAGIPVSGESYIFNIGHGRLMSFGANRWSKIAASPFPDLSADEAQDRLSAYLELTAADALTLSGKPELQFIALRAGGDSAIPAPYAGAIGAGYGSALVWTIPFTIAGETGTWLAQVDAHTGQVRSFEDQNLYARIKGGVYPLSDDRICPDGCEQPNYPMPYADITIGGPTQFANASGVFDCSPSGGLAQTTLQGSYVRVNDTCGPLTQTVTCDADLDLQTSGGIDCTVPAGSSAGNTHAARSSYYHLNRIAEHARTWLPTRAWLSSQLGDNVNLNQTCNAYWNGGSVNFFKSGGGCNNTGEIAGVFLHEWGHGLDQNDGGGYDNPSEAYADITAIMATHVSCVGRGFRQSGNCSGYGDACLSCSGIRDVDWAAHASGAPATPSGFVLSNCPGGSAPCGREVHCEGYVGGQTLWDLAVRDLPSFGLDAATAWQVADRLWYKSRNGSGGNAYNCALPNSDGCSVNSWFSKLRVQDDDDGNLANGTPHAAAIYAAFSRHKIACGAVGDASNQNHTSCPALAAPALTAVSGSASVQLTWSPVAGATGYRVLRNDASCSAGYTAVATVSGTAFTDTGLSNGFTEYYRVQPVSTNSACDGPLSDCQSATPQPFVGTVKLDAALYSCAATVGISVLDGNVGSSTLPVNVASTTEPGGETVVLTQSAPGSALYTATLPVTTGTPAADGLLSLSHGDAITATYVDGSDGQGGVNLPRTTTAAADCAPPAITKVEAANLSWDSARITWKTEEPSSSVVRFGTTAPPAGTANGAGGTLDHVVDVTGLSECTTYVYSAGSTDTVGNAATVPASAPYLSFATGKKSAFDYGSTDGPYPIPDQSGNGATSTINVPESKTIQDVNVTVNVTHTFDSDLAIFLIAPNGTQIPLAVQRGGSGDNFTDTVFDDEGTQAIGSGTAPFPSVYRPESPLSVLDGMNSAGAWKLKVEDDFFGEVGTLNNWKLTLTYPPTPCGPRAAFQAAAIVADTCGAGGAGAGNGYWDAGEQVQFKVTIVNTGTVKLTGVTATITSTTPGVVMVDGNASYPGLGAGVAADSIAPHFTVQLPTGLACGTPINFQMTINATEGSWAASFAPSSGRALGGTGTALNESFSSGIPATWSVVDGGAGGGLASTWTTANPGLRTFTAPLSSPVAIVDSDRAGSGATQDEQLVTPALNLTAAPIVTLQFDQFFRWFSGGQNEIADVDVRSSATGNAWVNVLRQQGSSSANPEHRTIDISAQAGRASGVQVRFRDSGGSSEWWWQVDNVRLDTGAYAGCDMPVCGAAQPNVARPVADGITGAPMRGSRANLAGSAIDLTWDVATCASADHRVLYGDLSNVASLAPTGASCDLGATGAATWNGVPAGNLWFVVVGDNNATVEGSWGTDGIGGQRGGAAASGFCGATARDNGATCP